LNSLTLKLCSSAILKLADTFLKKEDIDERLDYI